MGATTCPPVVGMIRGEGRTDVETVGKKRPIVKDCHLTLVKSMLALGSLGCLFVRSFVTMPKMAQYTGKWLLTAPQ